MVLDKVREILVNQLGVDEEAVTLESSLTDDLNIDSLDVVELIMAIEEEFGIEIPEADAAKVSTVGSIVDYIQSRI